MTTVRALIAEDEPVLAQALAQALKRLWPELRIDASPDSEYDVMAKVLAAAKNAQMKKIGFVQQ